MSDIDAEVLLRAYAYGVFPMAESRDDPELYWIDPEVRGILPLDAFHVPKRLKRTVRQQPFEIRIDTAFREAMLGSSEVASYRDASRLVVRHVGLYRDLPASGHAHPVDRLQGEILAGGLYGDSLVAELLV